MQVTPREGSVRFLDQYTQEYRVAEPGSMWFSTISMAAEDVFLEGHWQPLWVGEDDENDD